MLYILCKYEKSWTQIKFLNRTRAHCCKIGVSKFCNNILHLKIENEWSFAKNIRISYTYYVKETSYLVCLLPAFWKVKKMQSRNAWDEITKYILWWSWKSQLLIWVCAVLLIDKCWAICCCSVGTCFSKVMLTLIWSFNQNRLKEK